MEFEDWECSVGENLVVMRAPNLDAVTKYLDSFPDDLMPPDCFHIGLINSKHKYPLKKYLEYGCNQGMRKFGKNRRQKMKTSSGVVVTSRVEGVDPPDLTSQNLDLNGLYNSPYPVYINSLEDQSVLFLNPAALNSQGRKPSDLNLLNAYSLNYEDELQSRDRHLKTSLKIDEYEYQALRWYQNEEGIWLRKKMDFLGNFKKVEYLGVECRLSVILEAVPV